MKDKMPREPVIIRDGAAKYARKTGALARPGKGRRPAFRPKLSTCSKKF